MPRKQLATPTAQISIRLPTAQYAEFSAIAAARGTTPTAMLRKVVEALLIKYGAPIPVSGKTGTKAVPIKLFAHDIIALQAYIAANHAPGMNDLASAARAAMRVGLVQRGFLSLPEGSTADLLETEPAT